MIDYSTDEAPRMLPRWALSKPSNLNRPNGDKTCPLKSKKLPMGFKEETAAVTTGIVPVAVVPE